MVRSKKLGVERAHNWESDAAQYLLYSVGLQSSLIQSEICCSAQSLAALPFLVLQLDLLHNNPAQMSWFKKKETPGARTPEPQYDPYARRPGEENIPDEYESNRNALLGPAAGSGGRRPSPAPDHNGYRSAAPQRNRYDVREDEEEGSYRSGNTLRKAGPPPSAQAIAREANSIRAMPDRVARSGPNDQYSRGARDLDRDRNALFSGATVNPRASGGNNRYDEQRGGAGEEDEEEDLEAIQKKTKDTKQASVNSTRDALRMMRETEETGRSTLMKLGAQSEQLASTERHLQVSK
ncbi:Protein transport protein S9 plasma membrane t-SNARE, partial [Serendipita sp. 411]